MKWEKRGPGCYECWAPGIVIVATDYGWCVESQGEGIVATASTLRGAKALARRHRDAAAEAYERRAAWSRAFLEEMLRDDDSGENLKREIP